MSSDSHATRATAWAGATRVISDATRDRVRHPSTSSEQTARSRQIAALLGPTMSAIGASEAFTYRIWEANTAPLIALNGGLLFVAGLAIVRVHNRWTHGWPVLITLTGWLGVVAGLLRMFFPEVQETGENALTTVSTAIVFGAVGLVLTFNAYRRGSIEGTGAAARGHADT